MSKPIQIVPANGEVLVYMWPDEEAEGGEDPFFQDQCPVSAWKIVTYENSIWSEPILPGEADWPKRPGAGVIAALLMPSGRIYSMDGSDQFDTVEAFIDRWRKYYDRLRETRLGVVPS